MVGEAHVEASGGFEPEIGTMRGRVAGKEFVSKFSDEEVEVLQLHVGPCTLTERLQLKGKSAPLLGGPTQFTGTGVGRGL